jgi:hypothetical protein
MRGVSNNKNKLENAQRELRKKSETSEKNWNAVFFHREWSDPVADKLLGAVGDSFDPESTCGVWKIDREKAVKCERPFRGTLTPHG